MLSPARAVAASLCSLLRNTSYAPMAPFFIFHFSTMAYHQNPPLATAIPIPAPEAAGEYSLSRKSTDVDESMVKALGGQGYTRGKSTHRRRGTAVKSFFLVLNQSYARSILYNPSGLAKSLARNNATFPLRIWVVDNR